MAFVYKPSHSGTYRIGFYDADTKTTRSISARTKDKRVAIRICRDLSARLRLKIQDDKDTPLLGKSLKLSKAFDLYLSQGERKPKTITAYTTALDHLYKAAGDKPVVLYTKFDYYKLIDHFNSKNLSINSIANYTRHLHAIFKWLLEEDFINKNIIKRKKPVKTNVVPIPPEDLQIILNYLLEKKKIKQYNLVKIKFLCAFRIGEVIKCHGEDFDIRNRTVFVRNFKGNREEQISMLDDIKEFVEHTDLPGSGPWFNYTHPDSTRTFWKTAMKDLNFKYTFHQLRKSRGTQLANGKAAPLFLQKFMRHKDFNTTLQYYIKTNMDLATKDLNEAVKNLDYLKQVLKQV